MSRKYEIDDMGDSVDFALFEDGVQVGGGMFPLEFLTDDAAFAAAMILGNAFVESGKPNATQK